jgi:ADP-ribosyl-[dinitrogen reductase] hydrolase
MMLCLADALLQDPHDPSLQLDNYVKWNSGDFMSVCGFCFDCGRQTQQALWNWETTRNPVADNAHQDRAQGNGSLMRIAAVPILLCHDPVQAGVLSGQTSLTTHAHPVCVQACELFGRIVALAIGGASKPFLLDTIRAAAPSMPLLGRITNCSFLTLQRDAVRSSGYVLDTLEAALWAVFTTDSFEDALVLAVNLGDDADTVGAVCGTLAGALYGYRAIPDRWKTRLLRLDLLDSVFQRLLSS